MKECVFCSVMLTGANRSKEHIFPRWLLSRHEFADDQIHSRHWSYPNEPTEIYNERIQSAKSMVLGNVCVDCNTTWMAELEEDARPVLEALWCDVGPTLLTPRDCQVLANWMFKTSSTLNYSTEYKRIIPLEHLHAFFISRRLPENSTVDVAFCWDEDFQWVQGGNKQVALLTESLAELVLETTYFFTIQIANLMLRLCWTPAKSVKALAFPPAIYRVYPTNTTDILVQPVSGSIFRDHWQLHFTATIFSEDGVYPADIQFDDYKPIQE